MSSDIIGTGDVAVRVSQLGKRYSIGASPRRTTLYERIGGPFRRTSLAVEEHPTVWALRDVTFDVIRGRVTGILGRNGSGKSTLMRILARVTTPTEGMAQTCGRVGSLLAVGTGFHPELSGRDNITLSGAMLGMSKSEITALMPRLVEFSEVGRFLDTPVKHYSSGMYMRLAFSVSAHLHADIMLVDEVLSVGDAAFQSKSMERIREVVREGRTVLFVSHSAESMLELCDDGVVLDGGHVAYLGDIQTAISHYTREILGLHAQ